MLVEEFSIFGVQIQYWMLIAGAIVAAAILVILRTGRSR
jgi:putative solute:sodium symporter small subunit